MEAPSHEVRSVRCATRGLLCSPRSTLLCDARLPRRTLLSDARLPCGATLSTHRPIGAIHLLHPPYVTRRERDVAERLELLRFHGFVGERFGLRAHRCEADQCERENAKSVMHDASSV